MRFIGCILFSFLIYLSAENCQPTRILNTSEIQIALEKLNVLGSVLYIAAHPDDENTAALAYFSKGKKLRTAYLSLTRGDGGQNLIGSERGSAMGNLRTHELLEARKIDGAEQFFTRAVDFGYSKTPEESLELWGKDKILEDIVWVIRKFQPDVIITRFPPSGYNTHGHHIASAMLALEAFRIASDSTAFPEQLEYVGTWQPKRIFWNNWIPRYDSTYSGKNLLKIDLGKYNSILGKSYTEIAAESRSMHKSQGFGARSSRGESIDYFELLDGDSAASDLFDGIDTRWSRIEGTAKIELLIDNIIKNFHPENPSQIIPLLINAYKEISKIKDYFWREIKQKEIVSIIQSCSGLWLESISGDYSVTPGDSIIISARMINRSDINMKLTSIYFPLNGVNINFDEILENNKPFETVVNLKIPVNAEISSPYWLKNRIDHNRFSVEDPRIETLPVTDYKLTAQFSIEIANETLNLLSPLMFRWIDRVEGEQYRNLEIRPPVTINFDSDVLIFPNESMKEISITVKSNKEYIHGKISFNHPVNWHLEPELFEFNMPEKYSELIEKVKIYPAGDESEGFLSADLNLNEYESLCEAHSIVEINYNHIPRLSMFPHAEIKLLKLATVNYPLNIGYIMGSGDDIPGCLRQIGYNVTLLSDEDLEKSDLSVFNTIITGIRAFNTRKRLNHDSNRLLDYVKNGGCLVVQYNVSSGLVTENIGPYPFHISHDRITEEDAPLDFINKNQHLLNYPNIISEKDFNGWIQERGLYFADSWDKNYETVISGHDSNEKNKDGGLLYTKFGKGHFIYTGYSFFRQLPGGVPGAYRLFINLISAGINIEKENDKN